MISITRCDSNSTDFKELIKLLDYDLDERNGASQLDYNKYNIIDFVETVVIAYSDNEPIGCGCFKKIDKYNIEIKRMFVKAERRGMRIAEKILNELEAWATELDYTHSILETGIKQLEAIRLYKRCGYSKIENFGQYKGMASSVCFGKDLN